jgi:hypothetical protein
VPGGRKKRAFPLGRVAGLGSNRLAPRLAEHSRMVLYGFPLAGSPMAG